MQINPFQTSLWVHKCRRRGWPVLGPQRFLLASKAHPYPYWIVAGQWGLSTGSATYEWTCLQQRNQRAAFANILLESSRIWKIGYRRKGRKNREFVKWKRLPTRNVLEALQVIHLSSRRERWLMPNGKLRKSLRNVVPGHPFPWNWTWK